MSGILATVRLLAVKAGEEPTLRFGLRSAYLVAAIALLLMMPAGQASVMLVLFVAADLAAAALLLRPDAAASFGRVALLRGDAASLALLRRTVPELRMRRPAMAIDAQIRWRQAAEAHRRRREFPY
ncbi:MAG TPA: hypothetical protein VG308_15670 [Stellaceae bacterium]|nr:hypothetical protein [Stellaceae bacterium]